MQKDSYKPSSIHSNTTSLIKTKLQTLSQGLSNINTDNIVTSVSNQLYGSITDDEINTLVLNVVRENIEKHYNYSFLASRLLFDKLYEDTIKTNLFAPSWQEAIQNHFEDYLNKGIKIGILSPNITDFDIPKLSAALKPDRDLLFMYLGAKTVYDRYLLRNKDNELKIFELPQWFWMRIAMGLSATEPDKTKSAIQFYNILSKMNLISSTPTLFNSGTTHSQMSSCFINIVGDSIDSIFKLYSDCAKLSKWAGGIGTSWTPIRATGALINGTSGIAQGPIPFIRIYNDTALAVNQGGKRKGAMCAYMEPWHLDFEYFLELRKNTGDERRRAHDINTACWIPDLFMKRVQENGIWTLFCPSDAPKLHETYGKEFEKHYTDYEAQNLPRAKKINAVNLWRKILTTLYETGHPQLAAHQIDRYHTHYSHQMSYLSLIRLLYSKLV